MSKKSSTFAPDMKKMYHIPVMEIMTLDTKRIMEDLAGVSDHTKLAPAHHLGGGSGSGGPSPF